MGAIVKFACKHEYLPTDCGFAGHIQSIQVFLVARYIEDKLRHNQVVAGNGDNVRPLHPSLYVSVACIGQSRWLKSLKIIMGSCESRPATMPSYKLTYFDIRGLAEPARIMFAVAQVPYEDVRLSFSLLGL